MRKMLLGIYLALLGIASLALFLHSGGWIWFITTLILFAVSAYCALDGYFGWGPTARAEEDEPQPPLPPQYKESSR